MAATEEPYRTTLAPLPSQDRVEAAMLARRRRRAAGRIPEQVHGARVAVGEPFAGRVEFVAHVFDVQRAAARPATRHPR